MIYLVFGLALLAVFLLLGNALTKVPAASIARHARLGGVALLVALAGLLLLTGRFAAMSHVFALANHALRNRALFRNSPKGFDDVDGDGGSSGTGPNVRTPYLDMRLDPASGHLSGVFLAGPLAQRSLGACSREELIAALDAIADDGESCRLLEAYLDRTFAGWREHHDQGPRNRNPGAPDSGGMAEDEAYQVLGLEPGADPDAIRTAHRRLMASIHPDRGGSTYLATKVNLAKDVLLKLHG